MSSKTRLGGLLAASLESVREEDAAAAAAAAADTTTDDAAAAAAADAAAAAAAAVDTPAAEPAAEIADPDTLEADLTEAAAAEQTVDESNDAIAELEEVQTGLESICAKLEAEIAAGGLTPQAAEFMTLSVEAYTNRLGVDAAVPSLESFGGQTSRLEATKVSLEGIKETLQQIWQAIVNIAVKVRDAIVNFFKQLFDGAEKLKARAAKLKAAKIEGTAKAEKIKIGSIASKIYVDGHVAVTGRMVADLTKYVEAAGTFDDSVSGVLHKRLQALVSAASTGNLTETAGELKAPAVFSEKKDGKFLTPVLPGGVQFSIEPYSHTVGHAKVAEATFSGFTVSKIVSKAGNLPEEEATLSAQEIHEVADECEKLADVVIKLRADIEKSGSKNWNSQLKQVKFNKDLAGDKVSAIKGEMKQFQKMATAQDQATAKVVAWAVGAGRAYLAFAEKSAGQYGKAAAKADEKKDEGEAAKAA